MDRMRPGLCNPRRTFIHTSAATIATPIMQMNTTTELCNASMHASTIRATKLRESSSVTPASYTAAGRWDQDCAPRARHHRAAPRASHTNRPLRARQATIAATIRATHHHRMLVGSRSACMVDLTAGAALIIGPRVRPWVHRYHSMWNYYT